MANYKEEQQKTRGALKPRFTVSGKLGHMKQLGTRMIFVNRQTARQRTINRLYTKRGYAFGKRIANA